MVKLIVLDFDGTLVVAKKAIHSSIKKVLGKHGYRMGRDFEKKMGDTPLKEYLSSLGVKEKDLGKVIREMRDEFVSNAGKVKIVKGERDLEKLKQKKIILSNNYEEYLKAVIKNNGMHFSEAYSSVKHGSKSEAFKEILKKKGIDPKEVIYVGDRNIDAEVARRVGCVSVLVSQKASWSPHKDLVKAKPDFLIGNLRELEKVVEKLNSS
jgi:HAD superfamily hydrolase (TIGR01549 family)